MADINLWAVLLAAASAFLLGGIWYGPLFKHAWCREAGVDPDKPNGHPAAVFGGAFVLSLVAAAVFAVFLGAAPFAQVEHEGHALVLRALEQRAADQHRHAVPVPVQVLLLVGAQRAGAPHLVQALLLGELEFGRRQPLARQAAGVQVLARRADEFEEGLVRIDVPAGGEEGHRDDVGHPART